MNRIVAETKSIVTLQALKARMKLNGVPTRPDFDGQGKPTKDEAYFARCNGRFVPDIYGVVRFPMYLNDEDYDNLPAQENPIYTKLWDSNVVDEDGNQLPWPQFETHIKDEFGAITGTRWQDVGYT